MDEQARKQHKQIYGQKHLNMFKLIRMNSQNKECIRGQTTSSFAYIFQTCALQAHLLENKHGSKKLEVRS